MIRNGILPLANRYGNVFFYSKLEGWVRKKTFSICKKNILNPQITLFDAYFGGVNSDNKECFTFTSECLDFFQEVVKGF